MSDERTITAEAVRKEHLREVHEPAHWLYVAAVLGLSFLARLAFIAFLGAGSS